MQCMCMKYNDLFIEHKIVCVVVLFQTPENKMFCIALRNSL